MMRGSSIARRVTLGIALMCGVILTLLLIGEATLRDSLLRQQEVVTSLVRPLARLNALQQEITRIRALEGELTKMSDFFAVPDQIARINTQADEFALHLQGVETGLPERGADELFGMNEQWRRYRGDLARVTEAAGRMDMELAERYVGFLTGPRFEAISAQLKRLGDGMEQRAQSALAEAADAHQRHRRLTLAVSVCGVLAVGLILGLMAKSMLGRLVRLQLAARSVAEGNDYRSVGLSGGDELAELGQAFDTMQERVAAREQQLKEAYQVVEQRVQERTRELRQANMDLLREVGAREESERRLRLMSEALEQSPAGVMVLDMRGHVLHANRSFLQRSGKRLAEVVGRRPSLAADESDSGRLFQEMWMTVLSGSEWTREVGTTTADEQALWESMRATPVRDPGGTVTHALLVREDISVRKRQEQQILQQAHYDLLTGLPNRLLAGDRLLQVIGHASRNNRHAVVAFLDLDDFKKVNDSLGHEVGDELLQRAAERLAAAVRAEDTVARLGGDEFLVVMGEISDLQDAEAVARKVVSTFAAPIEVGGTEVVVSASVGLSVYPHDGCDAATLLRNADLAMYVAKAAGRNGYRFFDRSIHEESLEQVAIENLLRHAIDRGEFELAYQPIWQLPQRRLVGAEALLRWNSGERGLVAPDRFIGIAERTGQIVEIGRWVMERALRQLADWPGADGLAMAINVSPRQFRGGALLGQVKGSALAAGVGCERIRLEITEGLLLDHQPEVSELLTALTALDVQIVMDDFGTGYSSLSYLRRYPFGALKIDREFIAGVAEDPDQQSLVSAAIRLGEGLGLGVVAEGVETEQQLDYLLQVGCPAAQGYLLGRPVSADEFARRWLVSTASEVADRARGG